MNAITIPVVMFDDCGPTEERVSGRPCVSLGFTWQLSPAGQYSPYGIKRTYGMIDTGCDFVAIEEAFLENIPNAAPKQFEVKSPNATTASNVYRGTLLFFSSETVLAQETDFVLIPSSGQPYKIYLGRTFLQNATFAYDGPRGIDKLSIYPIGAI